MVPVHHAKELDGAASPRAFFGAELRRLRLAAGLSQDRLARVVFVSSDYIAKIEKATRFPRADGDLPHRLDAALGSDGHLARLFELALRSKSRFEDYFALFADLEKIATRVEIYSSLLVPGVLQTASYARSVFALSPRRRTDDEIEQLVAARLGRAQILEDQHGPHVWVVLDEAVLRRPVGGKAVMREQLQHIAVLARSRRITMQVVPFAVGGHPLMNGSLVVMHFRDQPPVAYEEALVTGQLIDDAHAVPSCQVAYDHVRALALPPVASCEFLEAAMEDCTDEP